MILYGPPGSGKDTITDALVDADERFLLHRRLKVGSRSSERYRMASLAELAERERAGDVLFRNERYGNVYAFARPSLDEDRSRGIPVLHVGQVAGVRALKRYSIRWLAVVLWCARETTARRVEGRGSTDVERRLAVWDETRLDLEQSRADDFDLRLDTDELGPREAARLILDYV